MNPSVFLYLFLSVLLLEVQSHTIYKNGQHSNTNIRSRRGLILDKLINTTNAIVEKARHDVEVAVNTVTTVGNKVKTGVVNFRCRWHKVNDKIFHHKHLIDPCPVGDKSDELIIVATNTSEDIDHITINKKPESQDINNTKNNSIDENESEILSNNKINSFNDNGDKESKIIFGYDEPSNININKANEPVEVKREDQNAKAVNQLFFPKKKILVEKVKAKEKVKQI
ncbi:uncharacterized protein [Diabrotica undecimpunctata]|uniref:uncharacterized protein n=1 Tax=Diabrotica undecimpunctata TaxID=50387 RepID=UPI003B64119D